MEAARSFTPEWKPHSNDPGTAVLELFAEMAEGVAERRRRVPEKHRVAFFDALGFSKEPPQPARLPLAFAVADGVEGNVVVPDGTRVVAEATDNRSEQTFEIADKEGFEATPATLQAVYGVNRSTDLNGECVSDSIFEHWSTLQTKTGTHLFNGENVQEHALYIGHNDVLNLKDGASVTLIIEATVGEKTFEKLTWEYYGVRMENEEKVEGWHDLLWQSGATKSSDGSIEFPLHVPPEGEIIETTLPSRGDTESSGEETETDVPSITELETRWIRGVSPKDPPKGLFKTVINGVGLSPNTRPGGLVPDLLLYNDIPLPTKSDEGSSILPFGETPRPLDTFYIASEEGFTKKGREVTVTFKEWAIDSNRPREGEGLGGGGSSRGDDSITDGGNQGNEPPLDISWEYWNGSGWDRIDVSEGLVRADGRENYEVAFEVPNDLSSTGVAGHDGYWIRVRLLSDVRRYVDRTKNTDNAEEKETKNAENAEEKIWEVVSEHVPRFSAIEISYEDEPKSEPAEHLVSDNSREYEKHAVSPPKCEDFSPFTCVPDEKQTLYLGFDKELDNGPIQVLFSAADKEFPETFYPRARWEYCEDPESDTWTKLSVRDGTESLTRRGIVKLVFANPTTAFERFGRELHWIRAKLIGDQFDSSTTSVEGVPDTPSVVISDIDADCEHVVIENRGRKPADLSGYRIDFGYDRSDGNDVGRLPALPAGPPIEPGECLTVVIKPEQRTNVEEPVVVVLLTPLGDAVTGTFEGSFGLRSDCRTVEATPSSGSAEIYERGDHHKNEDTGPESQDRTTEPLSRSQPLVPLELGADPEPTTSPLEIRGIHPNTGWADNVRTVRGEVVGSSDGSPDQEFTLANTPSNAVVWVDELPTLSEGSRTELERTQPEGVEEVRDAQEVLQRFWVRWTPVDDFLDSSADARQYLLDTTTSVLRFGDGQRGRIPPRGTDNIKADYRTGGGVDGNVKTGTVAGLESPLPFVGAVTNPEPGSGGVNAEPRAKTLNRASRELRDRGKAVAKEDFERIAMSASRGLARVRCVPGLDKTGLFRAGWVTLLLVPRTQEPKPVPSVEVKDRVRTRIEQQASATLTTKPKRLTVRGPSYIAVAARTTLRTTPAESVSRVEETVLEAMEAFLHPLTGASDGNGWDFGELPSFSDFYALLEGVDGVDHVESLELTFRGRDANGQIKDVRREGEPRPRVSPDALVFSGTHEVVATTESGADTAPKSSGETTTHSETKGAQ